MGLHRMAPPCPEQQGFLDSGASRIYWVRHPSPGPPKARVVLAGPFGLERETSYITWVRWARTLASRGFECIHFDFAGHGESEGSFEDLSLSDWSSDLSTVVARAAQGFDGPLLLCGLRFGALLAAREFRNRRAWAMLLWDPPADARAMLSEVLRRKLASDVFEGTLGERGSRETYVLDLEAGRPVEVEGFRWSHRLWCDAARWSLDLPGPSDDRFWVVVRLDGHGRRTCTERDHTAVVSIARPAFWGHDPLVLAQVSELFDHGAAFLERAVEAWRRRG